MSPNEQLAIALGRTIIALQHRLTSIAFECRSTLILSRAANAPFLSPDNLEKSVSMGLHFVPVNLLLPFVLAMQDGVIQPFKATRHGGYQINWRVIFMHKDAEITLTPQQFLIAVENHFLRLNDLIHIEVTVQPPPFA